MTVFKRRPSCVESFWSNLEICISCKLVPFCEMLHSRCVVNDFQILYCFFFWLLPSSGHSELTGMITWQLLALVLPYAATDLRLVWSREMPSRALWGADGWRSRAQRLWGKWGWKQVWRLHLSHPHMMSFWGFDPAIFWSQARLLCPRCHHSPWMTLRYYMKFNKCWLWTSGIRLTPKLNWHCISFPWFHSNSSSSSYNILLTGCLKL